MLGLVPGKKISGFVVAIQAGIMIVMHRTVWQGAANAVALMYARAFVSEGNGCKRLVLLVLRFNLL